MFQSRQQAGQDLAQELLKLGLAGPVVLALPRGGVPVAAEIAESLNAPLDLLIVQKVGAPGNPELVVAAIVEGEPPDIVLNREMVEAYGLDDAELRALVARERPELERRRTHAGSEPAGECDLDRPVLRASACGARAISGSSGCTRRPGSGTRDA